MRSGILFKTKNKRSVKKIITLALLVCFLLLAIFSEAFILSHAAHEHDHNGIDGGCAVCALLHNTENLFRQFGIAAAVILVWFTALLSGTAFLSFVFSLLFVNTPVKLKIRFNN